MNRSFLALFLMCFAVGSAMGQESQSETKSITVGTSAPQWFFGSYNAFVGLLYDNNDNELNISLSYFEGKTFAAQNDDLSGFGIFPSYRFYHDGIFSDFRIEGSKGIFYEVGLGIASIDWQYGSEKVSDFLFFPTINLGYSWVPDFDIRIVPYVGVNYGIGSIQASDGTKLRFSDFQGAASEPSGVNLSFGLDIGYMVF